MEAFHGQTLDHSTCVLGPRDSRLELETIVVGPCLQPHELDALTLIRILMKLFGRAVLAEYGIRDGSRSLRISSAFPILGRGTAVWYVVILRDLSQDRIDAFLDRVIRPKNGRPRAESDFVRLDGGYWVQRSLAKYYGDLARHNLKRVKRSSEQNTSGLNEQDSLGAHVQEEEPEEIFYSSDEEDEGNSSRPPQPPPVVPSAQTLGKRPERLIAPLPRTDRFRSRTENHFTVSNTDVGGQGGREAMDDDPPLPWIDEDALPVAGTTPQPSTAGAHGIVPQPQSVPSATTAGQSTDINAKKHAGSEADDSSRPVKRHRQLALTETSGTAVDDNNGVVRSPTADVLKWAAATGNQPQALLNVEPQKRAENAPNGLTQPAARLATTSADVIPQSQADSASAPAISGDPRLRKAVQARPTSLTATSTAPMPLSQASDALAVPRDPRLRTVVQNDSVSQIASPSSYPGPTSSSSGTSDNSNAVPGPDDMFARFRRAFESVTKPKAHKPVNETPVASTGMGDAGPQQATTTGTDAISGHLGLPQELAYPEGPVDPRIKDVKPSKAPSENADVVISRMMKALGIEDADREAASISSGDATPSTAGNDTEGTSRVEPEVKMEFAVVPWRASARQAQGEPLDVSVPPRDGEDIVMATSMTDEMVFVNGIAVHVYELDLVILMTKLYLWVVDCDGDIDMDGNY